MTRVKNMQKTSPKDASRSKQQDKATAPSGLRQASTNFDVRSICCGQVVSLNQQITADTAFCDRWDQLTSDRKTWLAEEMSGLMAHGFQVDSRLTPKLSRVVSLARRILRIDTPVDFSVCRDHDYNAFCHPSKKRDRFVIGINSARTPSRASGQVNSVRY